MKKSKKLIVYILSAIMIFSHINTVYASLKWPDNIILQSEAGIVIDASSGTVLYGKNIHNKYYPASITKILTALIVLENCDLNETFTFSHNAVYNVEAGSSSAGYDEGDTITVKDALYAMLIKSANEVANGLAEHCGGSIENFANMMNEKAYSLGCKNSHFSNPSGLNDENHFTTAYDFALISKAAFENKTLVEIDSVRYYELPPSKRNPEGQTIYAHHSMIKKNSSNYYEYAVCGKTGYTSLAGNTLVTYAKKGNRGLITVILNGNQTHYSDTRALMDFGFNNFKNINIRDYNTSYTDINKNINLIKNPDINEESLYISSDSQITVPTDADLSYISSSILYDLDFNSPDNALAKISYTYDDRLIGSTYLLVNQKKLEISTPTDVSDSPNTKQASNNTISGNTDITPKKPNLISKLTENIENKALKLFINILIWAVIIIAISLIIFIIAKTTVAKLEERERRNKRNKRRLKRLQTGQYLDGLDLDISTSSIEDYIKKRNRKNRF